jgi:hypothetical protein
VSADDWYTRLQATGLLDTLAPYTPAVVGTWPLGVQAPSSRIEIVCRATDLPAFVRTLVRAHGEVDPDEIHPGTLDGQEAVFAEFELDGLPIEVSAQADHVHRRLAAATLGISRVIEEEGEPQRARLAAAVARGEDWLQAALDQTRLTRAALEQLSTANPAVVRKVLGVPSPPVPLREYVLPLLIGFTSQILILLGTIDRGSEDLTGAMLVLQAAVLGGIFGTRLGLVAALAPVLAIGGVVLASVALGSESCEGDCALQFAQYTFVAVLVGSAAGVTGLLRDRYFPRDR